MLSPANITHLLNGVTNEEKNIIKNYKKEGKDKEIIPFYLFGRIECINKTAYDCVYNNTLNNIHTEENGYFSQINK